MMKSLITGKRVMVTGGAGFIGSNLAEHLAEENRVVIVDNFATGRRENLEWSTGNPNVELREGSILDREFLADAMKGIDFVFHQAAIPSVPRSVADPFASNETNVTGTLDVLLAARDEGVEKLVYAASSSAYGDTPVLPKVETMTPNPMSPYALTKLAGEHYCTIFNDIYGLRTTSLRYFNVYGPRQDPTSQYSAVIPKFVSALLGGERPVIYGDGEQSRDFSFIEDVIQANVKAALSKEADGKVINVARFERTTINELARKIGRLLGLEKVDPVYEPSRPGDVKHSLADISMAQRLMGYEPRFSIDEGLKITVEYFKSTAD